VQKFILSIREHENDRTRDSVDKMETETISKIFRESDVSCRCFSAGVAGDYVRRLYHASSHRLMSVMGVYCSFCGPHRTETTSC